MLLLLCTVALDQYVYLNQPLSICGASAHSIGAQSHTAPREKDQPRGDDA
jgi:hypothetical protein